MRRKNALDPTGIISCVANARATSLNSVCEAEKNRFITRRGGGKTSNDKGNLSAQPKEQS
jgi:hypothetical protein